MKQWSDLQLKFDLDLDEVSEDAAERAISPVEARQISQAAKSQFETGNDQSPDWIRDYVRLLEQGWPWRVACYIAWAASPRRDRWPGTLKDLATEVLGLTSPRVIYEWRRKYPAIDTVVAMLQAAPLWEHRADLYRALLESASTPDYKHHPDRKLALEMLGDYVPRSQLDVGKAAGNDLEALSEDELRRWLAGDDPESEDGTDGDDGAA